MQGESWHHLFDCWLSTILATCQCDSLPNVPLVEDLIQHEDGEGRAAVHGGAEHPHAEAAHDGGDQRRIRYPCHT